ncbi:MAG: hypothetical protein NC110_03225 [Ruminococcus sp.]|nr:hypothetical protein [Ruminococcus sp.]
MQSSKKLLILGGDKRQEKLYDILMQNGYDCEMFADMTAKNEFECCIDASKMIILPLPITKDETNLFSKSHDGAIPIDYLLSRLNSSHRVIGGLIKPNFAAKLDEKGISYFDFYVDEGFVTYNAFLTAQGAVHLMLGNTDEYVIGKKILITGFGRVGKAVSHFMKVIGLDVYVSVRSNVQKSEALSYGYRVLDISDIKSTVYLYDFIINTVPQVIFDENCISTIKDSCTFIELASAPFGAEKSNFDKHEKNYILAASLPGKLYPTACAKAIYKSIEKYL